MVRDVGSASFQVVVVVEVNEVDKLVELSSPSVEVGSCNPGSVRVSFVGSATDCDANWYLVDPGALWSSVSVTRVVGMLMLPLRSEGTMEPGRLVVVMGSSVVEWAFMFCTPAEPVVSMVRGARKTIGPEPLVDSVVTGRKYTVWVTVATVEMSEVIVRGDDCCF